MNAINSKINEWGMSIIITLLIAQIAINIAQFNALGSRIDALGNKIDALNTTVNIRLDTMNSRFDTVITQLSDIKSILILGNTKIDSIDRKVDELLDREESAKTTP